MPDSTVLNTRMMIFKNVLQAMVDKFGIGVVEPDVDVLNNSYLIYIGKVTLEVSFNEDSE